MIEPWEEAGRISERGSELTGLRAGIPVCAGTIDAFVESASVGVRDPGDVMLTYGTTIGIAGIVDEPRPSHSVNSTPGAFPGRYIMIGATSGALTTWLRSIADNKPCEELIAEAAATPSRRERLGGTAVLRGRAHADLVGSQRARGGRGLTLSHSRGHLYRAMLEATAYSARAIFGALHADGVRTERSS